MSYPILYPSTETEFNSNGIGVLSSCLSCVVTEERNGQFELQMTYPVDGIHYEDLEDRAIILAEPNPIDKAQPFRIYRSTKPINGVCTFYARHISYDLSGIPVSPFSASNVVEALEKLKTSAVVSCPFTFNTDKITVASMNVNTPASIYYLLAGNAGGILDVYGGEYKFDRFNVWLYDNRGTDRGVNIRYGKNMLDLEQERNCSNVYTGVYPYWVDTDGNLIQLPEKIVNAPGTYDHTRIQTLDLSSEWQEAPSTEQLKARAESYIKENNIGVPTVSLTVSHAMLENTEEYKGKALLERIDLCDTARIEFPKLGVSATAKAVETKYDVLLGRYESITFGEAKTLFVTETDAQSIDIKDNKEETKSLVSEAMKDLNQTISNASGMYTTEELQPDGSTITYLHDKKTLTESTNVIKITSEAVGVSTDGGKTFPFGLYVDGDLVARILSVVGVNANWINVGTMLADYIKGGTLTLGGANNQNGTLDIFNENNGLTGHFDNNGATFSFDKKTGYDAYYDTIEFSGSGDWPITITEIVNPQSIGPFFNGISHIAAGGISLSVDGDYDGGQGASIDAGSYNPQRNPNVWVKPKNGYLTYIEPGEIGLATAKIFSKSNQQLCFRAADESDYELFYGVKDGLWTVCPAINAHLAFGTSDHRWATIYTSTNVNVSSDQKIKHDIAQMGDSYVDLIMALTPVEFKLNQDGLVGTGQRTHMGLIAQDAQKAAMSTTGDLAFYQAACFDENGEAVPYDADVPDERKVWSIGYGELIAPIIKTVQVQQRRLNGQEKQIQALEEKLNILLGN